MPEQDSQDRDRLRPVVVDARGMARAVDLHFHLLPGVDDGPETIEESVELARAAAAEGTDTIVATPHVRTHFVTDVSDLGDRVREVSAAIAEAGIPVQVRCGGELGHGMVGRLRQEELESIAQGPPDGRWLLVEAPFAGLGSDFHDATGELRDRGFSVLIAHPERSADAVLDGCAGLRRELQQGSLAQVNSQSLTGDHGEDAARGAREIVGSGLAAVIASDAHGPTRPPALVAARERLLAQGISADTARVLTLSGPRRLLARGIPADVRLAA